MLTKIKSIFSLSDNESKLNPKNNDITVKSFKSVKFSYNLLENETTLISIFEDCYDFTTRKIKLSDSPSSTLMIVYIDNLTKGNEVEDLVIDKLTRSNIDSSSDISIVEHLKYILGIDNKNVHENIKDLVREILNGKIALFIDNFDKAMLINLNNPPGRNVEEPNVESVLRGPREGFTESLSVNVALIRKKIRNVNLKTEKLVLGSETNTNIAIMYISTLVDQKTLSDLKKKLKKIHLKEVLDANYIKENIEEEKLFNIPTVFSSEKPDVISTKLLAGRIAILTDGTPLVITCPVVFREFLETTEDYYLNFIVSSINLWIRYISFILTLILPGLYVAVITFHQELIPTALLVTFIKSRLDVPYPALFESMLLLIVYEILREAGVRMPRALGQAISVVGALVLGQAAVEAGLVSTPMVIVVSTTAISSFAIPSTDMQGALTLPRFLFLLLGGIAGLLGLTCGIIVLFMKFISISSFDIPYMSPLAPVVKDKVITLIGRKPFWSNMRNKNKS
ncbi:MAG: spore germination protein [Clostridiaceae bacterium]